MRATAGKAFPIGVRLINDDGSMGEDKVVSYEVRKATDDSVLAPEVKGTLNQSSIKGLYYEMITLLTGEYRVYYTCAGYPSGVEEIIVTSEETDTSYIRSAVSGALTPGVLQNVITITDGTPQEIVRGDKKKLTFYLGAEWDLTGRKAYFIAKAVPTADNAEAIVNRECVVTDEINGICEITLTESETSIVDIYHAEVEVRDADDTNPQTALQFKLKIIQDVRQ
jgi:hypothetical protein